MKLNRILGGALFLALAASASADQTIEITGATAFRAAAVKAIVALYGSGLSDIAHTGTTNATNGHEGANDVIFRGTIDNPACPGVTTIRCSWSGSVEGLNAIMTPADEAYLTPAAFSAGTTYAGPAANSRFMAGPGTPFAQVNDNDSEISFSDVFATSTPYATPALDSVVGIQPFFCLVNEGAPVEYNNMQAQKFGQLLDTGTLPANFLFATTSTNPVYLTGRNDGSGTRTTYVAISRGSQPGFGRNRVEKGDISGVITQWRPDAPNGSDEITVLRRWPTGDGASASTVWNVDTVGNGGFSSGSSVATRLGGKTTLVQRQSATGTNTGAPVPLNIVGVLGLSDAVAAQTAGARVLAWEGTSITVANPLASTEADKIRNGSYTLWSYEHMFANNLNECELFIYNTLASDIPANLNGLGVEPSSMNVQRVDDGTDIVPN